MPQENPDSRTEADQRQVEKRAAISVHVVHAAIYNEGVDELRRTPSALAWLSQPLSDLIHVEYTAAPRAAADFLKRSP